MCSKLQIDEINFNKAIEIRKLLQKLLITDSSRQH